MESDGLLIRGGRVIDPGRGIDARADLYCLRGRIERLGESLRPPSGTRVIEAENLLVCPGLIDAHCHLREPGGEEEETILSGARAAAAGGFTSLLAMPNTTPCIDSAPLVSFVLSRARKAPVSVFPIAAITLERAGKALVEMADLAAEGAIAFSDDGNWLSDSRLMRQALDYARLTGLPIIDHAEDGALAGGGVMNESSLSARLGLPGIPAAAEEIAVARDIALARLTGGRLHVAHLSAASSVALLRRARREKLPVTAEVTFHHLVLTEKELSGYNPNAKVSPPLRGAADCRALRRALKDGIIDILVTDHAPHRREEKETDLTSAAFGMIGFETAIPLVLELAESLPLERLIAAMTCNPARIFGLTDRGTLEPGTRADITIIDPRAEWTLSPENLLSRSRNTPFLNRTFKGRAAHTICAGKTAWSLEGSRR